MVVGDDGAHDEVPYGRRSLVEPPNELGHQLAHLVAVGWRAVGAHDHAVVAVPAIAGAMAVVACGPAAPT